MGEGMEKGKNTGRYAMLTQSKELIDILTIIAKKKKKNC